MVPIGRRRRRLRPPMPPPSGEQDLGGTSGGRRNASASSSSGSSRMTSSTMTFLLLTLVAAVLPSYVVAQTSFLEGRYVSTVDVSGVRDVTKDLADLTKDKYLNGDNSDTIESLSKLATNAPIIMADEPYYNFFTSSLRNINALVENNQDIGVYAHTIILDVFGELDSHPMASEAAVAIVIWMYHVHVLYEAVHYCRSSSSSSFDSVAEALDYGVAMYVGADQTTGDENTGYSMYNLAQRMALRFGQADGQDGEARVNTRVMNLYRDLQKNFVTNDACDQYPSEAPRRLHAQVRKIIQATTIPLIQAMIMYMAEGKANEAELYALQVTPLVNSCDPTIASFIQDKMVRRAFNKDQDMDGIMERLVKTYDCLGVTCGDVGAYETSVVEQCTDKDAVRIVGYRPSSDVDEANKIDLDVYQVGMLISENAIDAAKNHINYGHNSLVEDGFWSEVYEPHEPNSAIYRPHAYRTLMEMATDPDRSKVPSYTNLYQAFYENDPNYAYELIMEALNRQNAFDGASSDEVKGLVTESLSTLVLQMSSLQRMRQAIEMCSSNKDGGTMWDEAAAFLVGSIEGGTNDGNNNGDGILIFSKAKGTCEEFQLCDPTANGGSSRVMGAIMDKFDSGKTSLKNKDCASVTNLADEIETLLDVITMQSTLHYSMADEGSTIGGSDDENLGRGYVNAAAILPVVYPLDRPAADVIANNMNFVLEGGSTNAAEGGGGPDAVFTAFSQVTPKMPDLDCTLVGGVQGRPPLCSGAPPAVVPPPPSTGKINLAGYVPTTDVTTELQLSDDVGDMRSSTTSAEAKSIYEQGKNAVDPSNGGAIPISWLSKNAASKMSNEPYYEMSVFTLNEVSALKLNGATVDRYGDSIVEDVFAELETSLGDTLDDYMAADAVVVTEVWMEIVHLLFESVRLCEMGRSDMVAAAVDGAAALYVGSDQVVGDPTSGYMMYNLAERMAVAFGHDPTTGVSSLNDNVIQMFNGIQSEFVTDGRCTSDNEVASVALLDRVHTLVDLIKIPLIQGMVKSMGDNKRNYAELFALQVVPLIAMCDFPSAEDLIDKLIRAPGYQAKDFDSIMATLRASYPCMGVSCDEIGSYVGRDDGAGGTTGAVPACTDGPEAANPYKPFRDVVLVESFLDGEYATLTDVREYFLLAGDIALMANANDTARAEDIYLNGVDAVDPDTGNVVSVSSLSTSAGTRYADEPYFVSYTQTLDDIPQLVSSNKDINSYANTIISDIFTELKKAQGTSKNDHMAAEATIALIIWMEVVHLLTEAVGKCRAKQSVDSIAVSVDRAAALYVGAEQGYGDESSGSSLYRLSEFMSERYDADDDAGQSAVNGEVLMAFNRIKRDFLLTDACRLTSQDDEGAVVGMQIHVDRIVSMMKVTLVQALIDAMQVPDVEYAELFALAVTPLLAQCDVDAAADVQDQLIESSGGYKSSMFDSILQELQTNYKCMGFTCADVGSYERGQVPRCDDDGVTSAAWTDSLCGYITTTNVDFELALGDDLGDMLRSDDSGEAQTIYEEGRNAVNLATDYGGDIVSWYDLGRTAPERMSNDPYYSMFEFSLRDVPALVSDGKDVGRFGSTIVSDVFHELSQPLGDELDDEMASDAVLFTTAFNEVLHRLYEAVARCEDGDTNGVAVAVDRAVAMYVGSDQDVGDSNSGYQLYNHAERMADVFGQKGEGVAPGRGNGSSQNAHCASNARVMDLFMDIQRRYIMQGGCDDDPAQASRYLLSQANDVANAMKVPLIQGLIWSMADDDVDYSELYALAVTPLMAMCDYDASKHLQDYLIRNPYEESMFDEILGRLQGAYGCMGVSCTDVGSFDDGKGLTVPACTFQDADDEYGASDEHQPFVDVVEVENFLGGMYTTVTDVRDYFFITHDIRDIAYADDTADAEAVYANGMNAIDPTTDGGKMTLASFSLNAGFTYDSEPIFAAFEEYMAKIPQIVSDGKDVDQYANTIVADIFKELANPLGASKDDHMAAEATIVFVVWMEVVHLLTDAVKECRGGSYVDNVALRIDRAAALYVGVDQEMGDEGTGSSLYRLSEFMSTYFDQDDEDGQSSVNGDILDAFNDIKREFLLTDTCREDPYDAPARLQVLVSNIINRMKVTLVQALINAMQVNDVDYTEIYALQLSPLIGMCDASAAEEVQDKLITSTNGYKPEMFDDVLTALQENYKCMGISCEDVGAYFSDGAVAVEQCGDVGGLAGYNPTTDVSIWLKLSDDVRDMKASAITSVAQSIYEDGKNAIKADGSNVTLAFLSESADSRMDDDPYYSMFKFALGDVSALNTKGKFVGTYADTIVRDVYAELNKYQGDQNNDIMASDAVVLATVWMEVVHRLYLAVSFCERGDTDGVAAELDTAAALYVGSEQAYGDSSTGHLLYSLAERMADEFGGGNDDGGTCEVNREIMNLFGDAQQSFVFDGGCDIDPDYASRDFLARVNQIVNAMKVPLVQGLIKYMKENHRNYAELYALQVTPLVAMCNYDSSVEMKTKLITHGYRESTFDEILGYLQDSYACMGISCPDVGSYNRGEVMECDLAGDVDAQPFVDVVQVESLAEGTYTTVTDVRDYFFITHDIRDIAYADDTATAFDIFSNGLNAYNPDGSKMTLASFSLNSGSTYYDDRYFADFEEALSNVPALVEDGQSVDQYADTIVRDIFQELEKDHMAAEATIVTVVWMEVVHLLTDAVAACQAGASVDAIAQRIDRAAALYVGVDQDYGDETTGSSLYRLEEFMSTYYDKDDADGQSSINGDVLNSFNNIKRNFLLTDACGSSPDDAPGRLEGQVEKIINKMKVPLVQALIANVASGDKDMAELYALQVSPLMLCEPSAMQDIQDKLIEQKYDESMKLDIISRVQGAFSCMGITCADVGRYNDTTTSVIVEQCSDAGVSGSLAGYEPVTDVSNVAMLALDVKAIREAPAGTEEARSIYQYGRNAVDSDGSKISIASFSTRADLDMEDQPYHNFFKHALRRVGPLNVDDRSMGEYADTIVGDVFDELARTLDDESDDAFAANAMVAFHVWMEVVRLLYDAVADCEFGSTNRVTRDIDNAVALYVGFGQDVGSAETGHLLYQLAEYMAPIFGTELPSGESEINRQVISLFNEIKDNFIVTDACAADPEAPKALHVLVNRIVQRMSVPLVQTLIYHMHNDNVDYVELYALAVTPLVSMCSPAASKRIQDMLVLSDRGYEPEMFDDILETLQSAYSCMGILCTDVGAYQSNWAELCLDPDANTVRPIAGYQPEEDVSSAKIDLDILQVGMLIEEGAYRAAKNLINRGHNALAAGSSFNSIPLSLMSLATDPGRNRVPSFGKYTEFFLADEDYAYNLVMNVLNEEKPYSKASGEQVQGMVQTALQALVTYMSSLQSMYEAVDLCKSSDSAYFNRWDRAVSLFVGSIEGTNADGSFDDEGQMMYALAKKSCHTMNTCNDGGGSKLNDDIMNLFTDGKAKLQQSDCDGAGNNAEKIENLLQIIVIQNTLRYALYNANLDVGTPSGDLGRGFVMSEAIIPMIRSIDTTAVEAIEANMGFSLGAKPVGGGSDAVFAAFAQAIPLMNGIDCELVGHATYVDVDVGVCPDDPGIDEIPGSEVDTETPHEMSNGLYQTSTYVENLAKIGTDVMNIKSSLKSGNVNMAKSIYREGLNSDQYDENGILMMKKNAIADFSMLADDSMSEELPFNTFRYALQDEYGYFNGAPVGMYANTFVEKAFENTIEPTIAAEALVALHVWMQTVHVLIDETEQCKQSTTVASARFGGNNPVSGFDRAAALMLGDGQVTGNSDGHLLYSMAEKIGEMFGQGKTGQAHANTNIIKLLNRAKTEITFPNACATNSDTYQRLRVIVDNIVSYMTVPLVQNLIHYMRENDPYRVKLYALAVLPLIAGCNESKFAFLRRALIDSEYNNLKFDEYLSLLQDSYDCLGITCSDVGSYKNGLVPECKDPDALLPIAGYHPVSDVREQNKLDRDILQIRISMTMGAVSAAKDLYVYGRNSKKADNDLHSLRNVARDNRREIVPQYKIYRGYFEDADWADTILLHVFNAKPPFDIITTKQKTEIVVTTLQTMVMYMHALQRMHDAVDDCKAGDPTRNSFRSTAWDELAATLIGSIEGKNSGGTSNFAGQLMYNLAKENCMSMGTCTSYGEARVNDRLAILLDAGQGELKSLNCGALGKTVRKVESLLKVPLLQAALRYIARLDQEKDSGSKNGDYARGYVYTQSVLPLLHDADPQAAYIVEKNMDFENGLPAVPDGAAAVFGAVGDTLIHMSDVDCADIGTTESGLDVCANSLTGLQSGASIMSSTVLISLLSAAATVVLLLTTL